MNMLEGKKTYLFVVVYVVFELLLATRRLTLDPETANAIRAMLLGGAGMSLRSAISGKENGTKENEIPKEGNPKP